MRERLPGAQSLRRPFAKLTATDRLVLAYLAGLAGVTLARHPHPLRLVVLMAALALAILSVAAWGTRSRVARWVHDFFPVVVVPCLFNLSGPVIAAANPARWDAWLVTVDRAHFGPLVALWFGALGRPWWLTDAVSLLYVGYYVIPVAMGVMLYRSGRLAEFEHEVFTVVGTFVVSYVCYFLAPASGPRIPLDAASQVLGGGVVSQGVRWFLDTAELNVLDALPSGHVALSLVFLGLGWRLFPSWRWRGSLLFLVSGTIFATVYLSLHYVTDLVAGAALAASMPLVLPPLRRVLAPSEPPSQRPSSKARQRPSDQPMRSKRPAR
jgi:membrane-associated phospholipid phosphatase